MCCNNVRAKQHIIGVVIFKTNVFQSFGISCSSEINNPNE